MRIIVPFPAAGAVDATTLSIGLYKDLPYDPAKFVPITLAATLPNAIAGRADIFIGKEGLTKFIPDRE